MYLAYNPASLITSTPKPIKHRNQKLRLKLPRRSRPVRGGAFFVSPTEPASAIPLTYTRHTRVRTRTRAPALAYQPLPRERKTTGVETRQWGNDCIRGWLWCNLCAKRSKVATPTTEGYGWVRRGYEQGEGKKKQRERERAGGQRGFKGGLEPRVEEGPRALGARLGTRGLRGG